MDSLFQHLKTKTKPAEILAIYSAEIEKYPEEEWLYERRLDNLRKRILFDEQLQVYKTALAKFKTRSWQDRFARWFLRNERKEEFAELSQNVIENLDDTEVQNYLSQFIDGKKNSDKFSRELYLKLYTTAHKRFPHNMSFVSGLLDYYKTHKQETEWRKLSAEYYFDSKELSAKFLSKIWLKKANLRRYLARSKRKMLKADENSFDRIALSTFSGRRFGSSRQF